MQIRIERLSKVVAAVRNGPVVLRAARPPSGDAPALRPGAVVDALVASVDIGTVGLQVHFFSKTIEILSKSPVPLVPGQRLTLRVQRGDEDLALEVLAVRPAVGRAATAAWR